MKASIVKHVESSEINLHFTYNFNIEDVPDDVIINMLYKIENKLYIFNGNIYYLIIRRLSDNKILKCMVTDNN